MPSKNIPTRPTVAEISLGAIAHNARLIRRTIGPKVQLMAVVKANAYGHGLLEVGQFLEKSYADYFGVAFPEEGRRLRENGIRKPIHVATLPAKPQASLYYDFHLEPTICSPFEARILNAAAKGRRRTLHCHLKIDTGMNRIGIRVHELGNVLSKIGRFRHLEIKGVYTHFATSDDPNKEFMRTQLAEFRVALEVLRKHNVGYELAHAANSAAVFELPEAHLDIVRPGIALYGAHPAKHMRSRVNLKPALSWKSVVAMVKWIDKGESVSYGRTYIAPNRTQIATLPVGYADGYSRRLSGKAHVLIGGRRFRMAGRVCMDQMMVDAGNSSVATGDRAVLLGRDGEHTVDVWELADLIGTIPYEIFCGISQRIPRVYLKP